MKIKYFLLIATTFGLISLGSTLLQQSRTRAAPRAELGTIAVIAQQQPECAQCEKKCQALIDKCAEGGQQACYKAAACLCKCNLDAGGCGSSKDALRECVENNERAARELESPDPR